MKRNEIVNLAIKYLGVVEGSEKHKAIVDRYNSCNKKGRGYKVKYSDSWCACFVSSLFIEANRPDAIPIECSCFYMANEAKQRKQFETRFYTPSPGDVILYDWDKNGSVPDHVGIVKEVNNTTIIAIEGNKSDAVGLRRIAIGNSQIFGYVLPKYDDPTSSDNETIARQVIAGLWGNGVNRRKNLEDAGYVYEDIQAIVNRILKG